MRDERAIPRIGLGLSRIGSYTGMNDTAAAARLLRLAIDQGIQLFDTADIYGQGHSEKILGNAIAKDRARFFICTKVGYEYTSTGAILSAVKPILKPLVSPILRRSKSATSAVSSARSVTLKQNFSDSYLIRALDRSLRRLQTDYVDLLYIHSPPDELAENPTFHDALSKLKSSGSIHQLGISCVSVASGNHFISCPLIDVIQVPFSFQSYREIAALASKARQTGTKVVVREVLSSLLKLGQQSSSELSAFLQATSETLKRSQAAIALQTPLQLDSVSSVLVGTTNIQHLRENLEAVSDPRWPEQLFTAFETLASLNRTTAA